MENKKEKLILFILGLIIGGLISFFITKWGIYYSLDIQEQRDLEQMKLLEPNISIELSEISENQLKIVVSSMDENRSKVDNFFFDFELPGEFQNITEKRKWRVGECSIEPLTTGKRANYETIVRDVRVACTSINPNGYYVAILNYLPTVLTNQTLGDYTYMSMPVMNLRDYQGYQFTWTFDGESQTIYGCYTLSHLEYIKKDNENFIDPYSCEIYLNSSECVELPETEELENARKGHFCYKDMPCLLDYEYKNRNC